MDTILIFKAATARDEELFGNLMREKGFKARNSSQDVEGYYLKIHAEASSALERTLTWLNKENNIEGTFTKGVL